MLGIYYWKINAMNTVVAKELIYRHSLGGEIVYMCVDQHDN